MLSKNRSGASSTFLYDNHTENDNHASFLKQLFSKSDLTATDLSSLGVTDKNIGNYSLKKGPLTYGGSIPEVGSMLALLIRAEYKFPGIFSSYFMQGAGADAVNGKKILYIKLGGHLM